MAPIDASAPPFSGPLHERSNDLSFLCRLPGDWLISQCTDAGNIYAFGKTESNTKAATWPEAYVGPFPEDKLTEIYKTAANEILQQSDQKTGYCLVLGSEQDRLAYELAQQSELMIYAVESDAAKAAASRKALQRAGIPQCGLCPSKRTSFDHPDPTQRSVLR